MNSSFLLSKCSVHQFFKYAQSVLQGEVARQSTPLQRLHLGMELLVAVHLETPFDGGLARSILGLDEKISVLPESLRIGLKFVSEAADGRERREDRYLQRLEGKNQADRLLAYALARLEKAPEDVFWLDVLWRYRRDCEDWSRWEDAFVSSASCPRFFVDRARAEAACARGEYGEAAFCFRSLTEVYGPHVDAYLGHALLRGRETEEAVRVFIRGLKALPWHGTMAMSLFDVLSGRADEIVRTDASCAVLLYSYRKPELLDATLRSLHESDLGNSVLFVLDNGSGDATPDVINAWEQRFGTDRLRKINLPVNIGAPAARNWLLREVENLPCADVVFMDDDVSLPRDWLGRLWAAQAKYPEASVWGCKVVDYDAPHRIQSVDYTFHENGVERLQIPSDHLGRIDDGAYDYMRPCTSVTGCVHMFRTEELGTNGGFDIRYSPSQYDDVDRDLRLALRGGYAVYTGHAVVRHKRSSGSQAQMGRAAMANAEGNLMKLLARFGEDEMRQINGLALSLQERDLLEKLDWLRNQGIV